MSTIKVSIHNPTTDAVTNSTVAYAQSGAKLAEQRALWDAYQSAAQANLAAALAAYAVPGAWTATGTIHNGTAAPATPTTTVTPFTVSNVYCGAGSSEIVRTGAGVYCTIKNFFRRNINGDTTVQYRWVEEIPYIPPGSVLSAGSFSSGNQMTSWLATNEFPAGENLGANDAAAQANFISIMNNYLGYCPWPAESISSRTILGSVNSGFQLGYKFDALFVGCSPGASPYFTALQTTVSPGQTGRWRLESKTDYTAASSNASGVCKSSVYLAATDRSGIDDWGNGSPGTSRARFVTRVTTNANSTGGENAYRYYPIDDDDNYRSIVEGDAIQPTVPFSFTYPGASFLIQIGTPLAGYSGITGALVYDLQLKKWGKFKPLESYQTLIDFSAVNNREESDGTSDLGIPAGVLTSEGDVIQFETQPDESLIRYGKIGFSRLGMTNLLEVRLHFRKLCDCVVEIQGSMDGESLDPSVIHTEAVATVREKIIYLDLSARWFSISISGNFDLTGLEFRGKVAGRR